MAAAGVLGRSWEGALVGFADFSCEKAMRVLEERLGGGKRPSSTTQSLRSMNEVFRPRLGGDGDGDGLVAAMAG